MHCSYIAIDARKVSNSRILISILTLHTVDKGSRPKNRINHQRYSEADLKKLASTTD